MYHLKTVLFVLFVASTLGVSAPVFAQGDVQTIGFVSSPLWFDHEPFFTGETVRVYTTLANSSSSDFSGTVRFFDNEAVVGEVSITLSKKGGFQVVWIDWVPQEGEHTLSASVVAVDGSVTTSTSGSAVSLSLVVDTDTDGDGIGNAEDSDDDNDGILDTEDSEPLVSYVAPKEIEPQEDALFEQEQILEAAKEATARTTNALQEAVAYVTPKIAEGGKQIVSSLDTFRYEEGERLTSKADNMRASLQVQGGDEQKTDPFSQLKLLALTAGGYTLNNTILFYTVGLILLYIVLRKILPFIWRRVRGERDFT